MTLKQIRDAIIAIIGDDTELQTANYNQIINDGYRYIINKILDQDKNFFPDNESIAVTAGDVSLTPTKTWQTIKLVQIDWSDTDTNYLNLYKKDLETVLGANSTDERSSRIYCQWGDNILIPNFNKAATVRIYGYVVPDDMSDDTDTPQFSTLLHGLLVTYGIGKALESSSSSEDFVNANRKKIEFKDDLDELLPTVMAKDSTNVTSLT